VIVRTQKNSRVNIGARSRACAEAKPLIRSKQNCGMVGIPDIITCANFGEDRLRGLGVAGGQSLPFSIDFDRRLYNTLALPCECVILINDNRQLIISRLIQVCFLVLLCISSLI